MPALTVVIDQVMQTFPLSEGIPVFIGRARECDIHLTRTGVSRRHAVIMYKDGVCAIKDLGSFNGTYLNNKMVDQPGSLTDGDIIRISGFVFRFVESTEAVGPVLPEKDDTIGDGETDARGRKPSSTLRLPRAMTEQASVQHMFTQIKQELNRHDGEDTRMYIRIQPPEDPVADSPTRLFTSPDENGADG